MRPPTMNSLTGSLTGHCTCWYCKEENVTYDHVVACRKIHNGIDVSSIIAEMKAMIAELDEQIEWQEQIVTLKIRWLSKEDILDILTKMSKLAQAEITLLDD